MTTTLTPIPDEVTDANWDELLAAGYECYHTVSWPIASTRSGTFISDADYLSALRTQFGHYNVKLGHPLNHAGRPDASFDPQRQLCGIYARRP